ncbi:hypothetical protein LL037_21155 [Clostridium estertheticum]|uniref:hypothetical protein n=1 Tax=Clostridium estertheticum TaxID=238834 RepID=UPI001C0D93C5|nr:hypothetical protein [Clostridium estertheticum]MBU3198253.1 hypothetical protein [Clostridium estertheticum]MCB2354390.1 hypothetical protein [Clostridium estertheticum]WAG42493.1 hypothetical protein LL065_07405 [Clostridium estertheticum]WAG64944.1 hypothetical protein LL037_21155 [Clostridium estertheticum]
MTVKKSLVKIDIKKVHCKELYRLPITPNIIKEIHELSALISKKESTIGCILHNDDLSDQLKWTWTLQYMQNWHERLSPYSKCIKEKLNIKETYNLITTDLETGEIVVLDIMLSDYKRLLKENDYLFEVAYK